MQKSLIQAQYGSWWGKTFYRRFQTEVRDYYGKPLSEISMLDFIQCLQECWISYGWGTIEVNLDAYMQGYLIVILHHPLSSMITQENNASRCHVEAGFLNGFFSQLTQKDLQSLEIPMDEKSTFSFILGFPERLTPISALVEEGHTFSNIIRLICDS
ncbi:MAG: hypothetical protein HC810_00650 [Acaryochloridaceae cyanobacterium RL_2_7]|nr:hypothetical protein [Acaryochloridaceae cyanobacterium RL_2_7]